MLVGTDAVALLPKDKVGLEELVAVVEVERSMANTSMLPEARAAASVG